jgi:putative Mn2+ efflux pump MntP
MSIQEIFLIALALSADAFTVGLAVGIGHRTPRQVFRLSFHFGLFQALLPAVSAVLATIVESHIDAYDHYIGAGLLALIGGKTLLGAVKGDETKVPKDLTRGMTMVGLSLAVSIDAFAVGFPIGFSNTSIPIAVSIIGVTCGLLTLLAMKLASRVSTRVGTKAEFIAGLVLIGLGVKILIDG